MSCNCTGTCGCGVSTALPIGPTGVAGADGIYGGFSGEWLYSSTTTITPSAGQLRFNSNTSASVTNIFVSNTGDNSIAYSLFLASLANSSNYGWIRIFKEFDSTKFWMGKITAVTSGGTYYNLTVTYVTASNATITPNIFAASDRIVLSFSPKGETGTTGAAGANGSNGSNGSNGATGAQGPKGPTTLDYTWGRSDQYWVSTNATTYTDIAKIVFEGTTFHTGSPTKFSVIARLLNAFGDDPGQIRIYDTTNAVVIATSTSINSNSWAIYDLPITGAFPTGQALWTIQAINNIVGGADSNSTYLSALSIRF